MSVPTRILRGGWVLLLLVALLAAATPQRAASSLFVDGPALSSRSASLVAVTRTAGVVSAGTPDSAAALRYLSNKADRPRFAGGDGVALSAEPADAGCAARNIAFGACAFPAPAPAQPRSFFDAQAPPLSAPTVA